MTQKQVVVVTGCTAGGIGKQQATFRVHLYWSESVLLGYSMAKTFAQKGHTVFATARRVESMAGIEGMSVFCSILVISSNTF
jgi:NADP-dependent 3-hydroxy acid dehydrogenase YdfG